MTLTLLDLYNTAASQEWAMYDNDAISDSKFEDSFVLAINKSIIMPIDHGRILQYIDCSILYCTQFSIKLTALTQ